jgi:GxxExxY protein
LIPPLIHQWVAAANRVHFQPQMEKRGDELTMELILAARAVHQSLGPGFVETVYNKAFCIELRNKGFAVEREKLIRVIYASCIVGRHYLDLVVENQVVLELKAARAIIPVFEAQMQSYLVATDYPFGLIINFGMPQLEWKQVTKASTP